MTVSMLLRPSRSLNVMVAFILALLLLVPLTSAHFEIVYPPWRGNTLIDDMQWKYPCGGLPVSTNRTKWPITGGSISVIPGWNSGHPTAFFYVNMGYGTQPVNHSNPMVPIFQITGPSRDAYPGSFCLTQVPLPVNATQLANIKPGDNATIQVIEVALHGASLYNCADITFVETAEEAGMPADVCFNSTTIGFNQVFTTRSLSFGVRSIEGPISQGLSLAMMIGWGLFLLGGEIL